MSPAKTAIALVGIALFVIGFWLAVGFTVAAVS